MVATANEWDRQGQASLTLKNKGAKKLDLSEREIYSTTSFQLRISNQQAWLWTYDYNIWDSIAKFKDSLPQDTRQEFASIMEESKMVARASLRMVLDAADSAVSMQQCSLLQSTEGM